MTRDDIIRMARDAGFVDIHHERVWIREGYHEVRLERFAALVAAAEREACIAIIVDYDDIDDADVFAICDTIREREGK